ncbi:MAG: hypothetical protein U0610_12650 [bacterium]
MTTPDERRTESRTPDDQAVELVVARSETTSESATRIPTRLVDRSRSGCCLALEKLQFGSIHLLDCIEDPGDFRIEVRLPSGRRDEPVRTARVVWINRIFEGAGPAFRIGLKLGAPARG